MIKKQRTALCHLLIAELRIEGLRDRQLARFDIDDDVPRVPSPRSMLPINRQQIPKTPRSKLKLELLLPVVSHRYAHTVNPLMQQRLSKI